MPEYQKPDPNTDAYFAKLTPSTEPIAEPRIPPSDALPWYLCHKMVRAAKIEGLLGFKSNMLLHLEGVLGAYPVSEAYVDKHAPMPGGYYVKYADGYESFSPAEAFEAGYTRCDEQAEAETPNGRILTCVYCGHEYPQDTPAAGAQILTDHIRICEKHPMRQLEKDKAQLREALIGIVGMEADEDLAQVVDACDQLPIAQAERIKLIAAAKAIRDTATPAPTLPDSKQDSKGTAEQGDGIPGEPSSS